jgi:exosortase
LFQDPEDGESLALQSYNLRRSGAILALVLAFAFAYRQLFFFDPNLYAPNDIEPIDEWFFSFDGTSPLIIYGLTAWFITRRRHRLFATNAKNGTAALGATGILAAIGLLLWGYYVNAFQVLAPSVGILLVSSGLFLGGIGGARLMLMPSVFVVALGTPIPTPLLNHIIFPMQLWAAEFGTAAIRLLGYSVSQSGDLILTQWAVFQVIETCAGLRSTLTIVMAAFVYCELLGHSRRRWIALLVAAPLIGLAANFGRVLLLVFIPTKESQPEHSLQGIAMTIAGVVALWAVDEALDLLGRKPKGTGTHATDQPALPVTGSSQWKIWTLASLVCLAGIATQFVTPRIVAGPDKKGVHAIPREIGDWSAAKKPLIVDTDYLGSTRFSSRTWRKYRRGDESVSLFVGMNDRLRRVTSLVSEKTKTLESGTFVVEETPEFEATNASYASESSLMVLRTKHGEALIGRHWYEHIDGLWTETFRSMFALDRGPGRREMPSRVIRISTQVDRSTGGEAAARRRLEEFSGLIRTEIRKLDDTS